MTLDPRRLVEQGYDQIADAHLEARSKLANDEFLTELASRLRDGARVLDAGCGAGVPVARFLSARFQVVGVDISAEQLKRAGELVPLAAFCRMDMTALAFLDDSFDAICSLYAIFHVPRDQHAGVFQEFYRVLRSPGHILVTVGSHDEEQWVEHDWFGVSMYWSSFAPEKSLEIIRDAGFEVVWSRVVTHADITGAGEERNLFVLAKKR